MAEPSPTTLAALDAGQRYAVTCPDGLTRTLWGDNPATGDLFVAGWPGDVWMDCEEAPALTLEALAQAITSACRTDQAALTRERCTLALRGKLQPTTPQASPAGLFAGEQCTLL